MDDCLKSAEVEAFAAGELSAEDHARCASHIASCPTCRKAVEAGREDRDLVDGIQQAYGQIAVGDSDSTFGTGSEKTLGAPASIEGFEILGEIHRGGQGVVYKAVQLATKRTVALKVLLQGPYASPKQQHRFEREIDLVASLQHPNIVTVYDSGLAHGRYYFAMEYIRGESLDAYVSSAKLSIDATLRLFQKICLAVNSAHQHGVIHRDLKPGNIRVDSEGEPHILDFGLAKAAGSALDAGVPVTMSGEFMGTLAYASPEQTKGDPTLIDIRTDIYSLGVILFEMLTGKYPYAVAGRLDEVLRNIADVEPTKPSTIRRHINDEIDTMVLTALAKERERRYQSAEAFARDIGRYLAGEAIEAKRDSTWYVLRLSLRRYRVAAGVAAAFVLILAASTVSLSVMYQTQRRARQAEREQRTLAEQRLQEATAAKETAQLREAEAVAARAETQKRADELEVLTQFQQSMLGGVDAEAMGRALYADLRARVRETLEAEEVPQEEIESAVARFDRALRRANATDVALKLIDEQVLSRAVNAIESDFADQPVVGAALRQTVADTYREIGRYPPALPLQEAALSTRRTVLGVDHPATLESISNMGSLLESMGKFDEAHDYYREALQGRRRTLGDDHPETLTALNNMGLLLQRMGKPEEAQAYYDEALEGSRRVLGDDHPNTLSCILNTGSLFEDMGRFDEALAYYGEALTSCRSVMGDDHPETLTALNNMANLLQTMGRFDEALTYHSEALAGRRRVQGDDHPLTLASINNMGVLLMSMGRDDEALAHFREALEGWRRTLGDDHPNTLVAVAYVGVLLKRMGRLEEAEPYFLEALEGNRRALGKTHPSTIGAIHNMGRLLRDLGRIEEAEAYGAKAVRLARQSLPEGHTNTAAFLRSYGVTLTKLQRYAEAEAALLEAYGILKPVYGTDHRRSRRMAGMIADLYDAWHVAEPEGGYDVKAAEWRRKSADSKGDASSPRGSKQ